MHPHCRVLYVVDADLRRAEDLATAVGAEAGTDVPRLLARQDVDAIVVATPHKHLAPLSCAALEAGKHVFCEKPMARTAAEAKAVLAAAAAHDAPTLVVGFSLRYHHAVRRAWNLVMAGTIGEPYYVRGRYGHGGRPGYADEWRMNTDVSGGGELLDQGVHLIDLSRCFLGEFENVAGFVETYYWEPSLDSGASPSRRAEDNAFLLLRTRDGQVASLHASWTQWKNLFSFEVFGRDGFVAVEGLGGSYGPERLTVAHRKPEGGAPTLEQIGVPAADCGGMPATPATDDVWFEEWSGFVSRVIRLDPGVAALRDSGPAAATALDACRAFDVIEKVYGAGSNIRA